MAERSKISWCDATANFAMGCQKVSEGCRNCYALELTKNRMGLSVWGPKANRQHVKGVYAMLRKLAKDEAAGAERVMPGGPMLVFCGSLFDWAEDHPDIEAIRPRIWEAIRAYPGLTFQLLTKRPERIAALLPADWGEGYQNVWLGTSVEDMRVAARADHLRKIPAVVRFISYEPALGSLDDLDLTGLDWILYGGESGPGFRPEGTPEDPKAWARSMRARCEAAGVAFFHKQSAARFTERGQELDGEIVHQFPSPRQVAR